MNEVVVQMARPSPTLMQKWEARLKPFEGLDYDRDTSPPLPIMAKDDLISLDAEIHGAMLPSRREAYVAAGLIIGSYRKADLQDPATYSAALVDELSEYASQIFPDLVREIRRNFKWFPTICEIVEVADRLVKPLHKQRRLISSMLREHERRENEKREADAAARRNAEHRAERRRRIREAFPDRETPTDSELDDADRALPSVQWQSFNEAMFRGDDWTIDALAWLAIVGRVCRYCELPVAILDLIEVARTDLDAGRARAAAIEASVEKGEPLTRADQVVSWKRVTTAVSCVLNEASDRWHQAQLHLEFEERQRQRQTDIFG